MTTQGPQPGQPPLPDQAYGAEDRAGLTFPPNGISTLFDQALILFEANRLAEAELTSRRILSTHPGHFETLHLLGVVLTQRGDPLQGLRILDEALRIRGDSAALCNSRGNVLAALRRLDEALTSFELAIALDPSSPIAFVNIGNLYGELGRLEAAIASYEKAISLNPDDAEAFYNLGAALQGLRRLEEAVASYDRAIALEPDHAAAFSDRGTALQALGRLDDAMASYNAAIALKADLFEAFSNRGSTLHAMRRYEEAVASYDQATALKPDFARAFNYRGISLQALGRYQDAVADYDKATAILPDYVDAFGNLGDALRALGRLDEAVVAFERAVVLAPRDPVCHFNLVGSRRVRAADPHFAAMKELALDTASLDAEARIKLHFGLAKAFADTGDPKQSSHHLLAGNALKRQQVSYDEAKMLAWFSRIEKVFTAELMRERRGLGNPATAPVFIVGMPRSGTTLVEQILASHPKVFGAGELWEVTDIAARIRGRTRHEFPEAISELSDEQLRQIGMTLQMAIRRRAPAAERIIDKMPINFCYAGLIHLVLPNARIIHTRRDPRDTALSCFSILFAEGQLEFTYNLAELGRYLRAYQALMEHWHKTLPGVILDVQYEELVDNPEAQARRIVGHCGLEWDDACLAFHKTERVVSTASATQVRQPVYRSSVGRWRDYEELLQPLLQLLPT